MYCDVKAYDHAVTATKRLKGFTFMRWQEVVWVSFSMYTEWKHWNIVIFTIRIYQVSHQFCLLVVQVRKEVQIIIVSHCEGPASQVSVVSMEVLWYENIVCLFPVEPFFSSGLCDIIIIIYWTHRFWHCMTLLVLMCRKLWYNQSIYGS